MKQAMTSTQKLLKAANSDSDRSPVCKRARYEVHPGEAERWTLSKNEIILHSTFDSGLDCLASDTEYHLEHELNKHRIKSSETPTSRMEQIAVLEASLPEYTLQKLSLGQWNLMLQQESRLLNERNMGYFDRLSDEVVLNIFQKLPKSQLGNVALVCRRFSLLIEDESLWTQMDVSNKALDAGALGTIMNRQVIILRLARSSISFPPILPNTKAYQSDFRSRLMYLDLTMATVSPSSLVAMFSKCRKLKKLSLESVPINDGVLNALSCNKDLEVVNLAMTTGIGLPGIKALLSKCRKIKELNMSWTSLSVGAIEFICENLPRCLDRLNFSGCRKLLQDNSVSQIVLNCPHLRELDLSDCTTITGDSVKKFTSLDELNFLSLSRCYQIPYNSLLHLKAMKSLAYLDIHGSYINAEEFKIINDVLGVHVNINKFKFSSIARPTVGLKTSKIWNMTVRD